MLAKKVTYTDFNGEERTETFYFNLTKAEVAEMQLTHPGGYTEYIQRIIDSKQQEEIIRIFKELLLKSYGEKSEDGKHFRKSKEISEEFSNTEAYSEIFVELMTNANEAAAFVNGIMPKVDMTEDQKAELARKTKALIDQKAAESE